MPPRTITLLVRWILPRKERGQILGDLEEEYTGLVLPRLGRFRAGWWYRYEGLSLLGSYFWARVVRRDSREVSVILAARRSRRRSTLYQGVRERSGGVEHLRQDIRHGLRTLAHRPAFTLTAMATLAIGIAANTAIFSLLHGALLRPLPFERPGELVSVYESLPRLRIMHIDANYPDYLAWRGASESFESLAAHERGSFNLTGTGDPARLNGARVSYNLFRTLGIQVETGRGFGPDDDVPGAAGTVILGHGLWQGRFGGDPEVIGRTLTLDGESFTVIGIAPVGFRFPEAEEFWIPFRLDDTTDSDNHFASVIGRLKPGGTLDRATQELVQIREGLPWAMGVPEDEQIGVGMMPLNEAMGPSWGPTVVIFYGVVCLVLLLACANIANLMLSGILNRQTEIALRATLGAGRMRIIRQLLIESLLIAAGGGAVGLGLGLLGRDLLIAKMPVQTPYYVSFDTNLIVVLSIVGITMATGVLFGIAPALGGSAPDLAGTLRMGGPRTVGTRRESRLRSALIVLEVSLAIIVLIGAGLMMKSYMRLQSVDAGFDLEGVLTARISLPESAYSEPYQHRDFFEELQTRLKALPGTESVAAATTLPMTHPTWARYYTVEGWDVPLEEETTFTYYWRIQREYFDTLRIPILQGRGFTEGDEAEGAPPVVIVSRAFARKHWPDSDPIGKRMKWGMPDSKNAWMEVVGVVGDIRESSLDQETASGAYITFGANPLPEMDIAVRCGDDPREMIGAMREAVWSIDPDLPIYDIETADVIMWRANWSPIMATWLFGIFSVIALLLAAVGIYGVIAHAVSRRTRELGIRIALGAGRRDVFTLVLRQTAGLAGIGLLLGLCAALAGMRIMSGLLYGVQPTDFMVYSLSAFTMVAVVLAAGLLPVRRAVRIDPMEAVRDE